MGTIDKKLRISSFVFSSKETEVLIKGIEKQGSLSFETEMIISQSQLNNIINQLQQNDPDFCIENYLNSQKIDIDEELYYADLHNISNNDITLNMSTIKGNYKQIRA